MKTTLNYHLLHSSNTNQCYFCTYVFISRFTPTFYLKNVIKNIHKPPDQLPCSLFNLNTYRLTNERFKRMGIVLFQKQLFFSLIITLLSYEIEGRIKIKGRLSMGTSYHIEILKRKVLTLLTRIGFTVNQQRVANATR